MDQFDDELWSELEDAEEEQFLKGLLATEEEVSFIKAFAREVMECFTKEVFFKPDYVRGWSTTKESEQWIIDKQPKLVECLPVFH